MYDYHVVKAVNHVAAERLEWKHEICADDRHPERVLRLRSTLCANIC